MGDKYLVFVYGTLRRFGPNSYRMRNARFIGNCETSDKYSMYVTGLTPWVVRVPASYPITGELYEVNKKLLAKLDALEGHPYMYKREKIHIISKSFAHEAYMYIAKEPPRGAFLRKSGDFTKKDFLYLPAISRSRIVHAAIGEFPNNERSYGRYLCYPVSFWSIDLREGLQVNCKNAWSSSGRLLMRENWLISMGELQSNLRKSISKITIVTNAVGMLWTMKLFPFSATGLPGVGL